MFRMPNAAAPRISDCMAMRLRSRQTICITGSNPMSSRSLLAAIGGHAHHGGLVVRHVDGIDESLEQRALFSDHVRVHAAWRTTFTRDCKMSRSQYGFEMAVCFHLRSSRVIWRGPPSRLVDQSFTSMIFS